VFTARYALSPYIKQISFVFKGLTLKNDTVSPHNVFISFVKVSEQRASITLYRINCFVLITQNQRVYWAVRTESLGIPKVSLYY
jgi:hypothetical protein